MFSTNPGCVHATKSDRQRFKFDIIWESNMRQLYLISVVCAAIVASSTMVSAQGFRDDPPGWAFQKRGIIEMNGGDPLHYGRGYGRGAYAWARHYRHYRHHRYYRHYRHHRRHWY
jgi:hypothetical protein